ncbi:MAG: thrombospondin type 3 repeat-containing protein [Oligoflexia bacterium]|nr:thrombospondin type 3 repeat-containing protein [Oligoflexia bacterium]
MKNKQSSIHKLISGLGFIALGVALSGVNYCQRSYEIGAQTDIAETATASPTDDGSGDTVTVTPTVTPAGTTIETPGVTVTATKTPEGSVTPTATVTVTAAAAHSFIKELRTLSRRGALASTSKLVDGNWLGQAGQGGAAADQDQDGYMDWFEEAHSTDPLDRNSAPQIGKSAELSRRLLRSNDPDSDGISSADEVRLGTDPQNADSDGDGAADGAEIISGFAPFNAASAPHDTDGDGLSDEFEQSLKTDAHAADTDRDGLSDDREIVYGSNPLAVDSDGDGVTDGREVALGLDPANASDLP